MCAMTRVSGSINFPSMNAALDGVAALREAGFEAKIDHDLIEVDGSWVFGAVWCDIANPADVDKVWDRILIVVDRHCGDCYEFGVGSETTVWRD
jgi:hypothetical protein